MVLFLLLRRWALVLTQIFEVNAIKGGALREKINKLYFSKLLILLLV